MHLLCHRGIWTAPEEKNTVSALVRALEAGHGIETDIRDRAGELVISHDPPDSNAPPLATLLEAHARINPRARLALNIKADGLAPLLTAILEAHPGRSSCFCFDMSAPETLRYRRSRLPYFTRESDYEPHPVFLENASGVWMDCFEHDWVRDEHLGRHLNADRLVALVSPELHGREPTRLWTRLSRSPWRDDDRLLLCTDHPDTALSCILAR